jgi:hypothetical protein
MIQSNGFATPPKGLSENFAIDIHDRGTTDHGHIPVQVASEEADSMPHTWRTGHGGGIHERSPQEYESGAERKCLEHISTTPNSAIHHHNRFVPNRICDLW